MNFDRRLNRLEERALNEPPNGVALLRELMALPLNWKSQWLRARTDEELKAIVLTDDQDELDVSALSDDELRAIVDGRF